MAKNLQTKNKGKSRKLREKQAKITKNAENRKLVRIDVHRKKMANKSREKNEKLEKRVQNLKIKKKKPAKTREKNEKFPQKNTKVTL